jgi:indole-3-glycerol phosphate synthase
VTVLARILEATRQTVARRQAALPLPALEARLELRPQPRPFAETLRRPGLSVIAEHKRRSPSAGMLRAGTRVDEIARAYEAGGAGALSVLTEPHFFAGSLDDLREARGACKLPVLRKDFIIDRYQLYEAAVAGADAVLLIVAALDRRELAALHGQSRELGLAALVEVHDRAELDGALGAGAEIVGINNRDLTDFSVDVGRTYELLPDVPQGTVVVSESGFHHREDVEALERAGVDAVLVGERLMRADDPAGALRELMGAHDLDRTS